MNNNENISISKLLALLDIQDDDSYIITDCELVDENKYLDLSTAAIAERFNISDTLAHILFERYVDLPRLPS